MGQNTTEKELVFNRDENISNVSGDTRKNMVESISKEEAEKCRHHLEKRWYRRLIELNFLMIIVTCSIVFSRIPRYEKLAKQVWTQVNEEIQEDINEDQKIEEQKEKVDEDDIPFELEVFCYGILTLVAGYLSLYIYYAYIRSMSLRITEHNFPEMYERIEKYAKMLGMEEIPRVYVMQSNGVLNAFSTFIYKKQYIEINSEIFESAYREHHDIDSVSFVIAHELAHIYYGHATLHYNLPIWFSMRIPLFGSIASRAREYSADRLAQRITGTDGVEAMLLLMVDRHLYKMVDREDYLREAEQQKGFFLWLVNLFEDHPVMCKRIRALDAGEGSGELY